MSRNEYKRRWANDNKDKLRQYIINNYEWYLWNSAKQRARRAGLLFEITKEDIVIPDVCPYLGIPMTRIQGEGRKDTNPSLDRKDNSKGYTKDNIEVLSDKANRMKNSASPEELVIFAKEILKRYA